MSTTDERARDPQRRIAELEHSLEAVIKSWGASDASHKARIAELERERDAQRKAADHWFSSANQEHNDYERALRAAENERDALLPVVRAAMEWSENTDYDPILRRAIYDAIDAMPADLRARIMEKP